MNKERQNEEEEKAFNVKKSGYSWNTKRTSQLRRIHFQYIVGLPSLESETTQQPKPFVLFHKFF
jgi:hypothetical protein